MPIFHTLAPTTIDKATTIRAVNHNAAVSNPVIHPYAGRPWRREWEPYG